MTDAGQGVAEFDRVGVTYLLVDGENIDATLGGNILNRRPNSEERPRWQQVVDHLAQVWQQPVRALFFLNASSGHPPMPFVQALMAMGYRPVMLAGPATVKVVDVGIQRTLDALTERPGDVVLASHDVDFLPQVRALVEAGSRRTALLGFNEFVSAAYDELRVPGGLHFFDLESDVGAFTKPLPRVRIIPIEEFDPAQFL